MRLRIPKLSCSSCTCTITPAQKIYVRNITIFLMITGSLMMLIIGSIWVKFDAPVCGKTLKTAEFFVGPSKVDTKKRVFQGNACPGYDWTLGSNSGERVLAGEHMFSFSINKQPRAAKDYTFVAIAYEAYVEGPIGMALNGVPIYSPSTPENKDAVLEYIDKFDQCAGSNEPTKHFTFSAKVPGYYHYHSLPGDVHPDGHDRDYTTSEVEYCHGISSWYTESPGKHSPLVGFMADGIPIYGVQAQDGQPPDDLDECGGHFGDGFSFYHYHFKTTYPYSVECLIGCVDGSMNPRLDRECVTEGVSQYDYSSLDSFTFTYGGNGINYENWTGPASLLTIGFLLFIPGVLWWLCICCDRNIPHLPLLKNMEENIEDDFQFL